jgi:hypothetical protein
LAAGFLFLFAFSSLSGFSSGLGVGSALAVGIVISFIGFSSTFERSSSIFPLSSSKRSLKS